MSDFNLVEEEWIPVLYHNGEFTRVGIRKALAEAGQIRQIAASNPMDRVALLRFLLAVLLWCKDDAKTALATLDERTVGVPADWLAKLNQHSMAFRLLGNGSRFYQESLKDEKSRPIADLLVEFPGADSVNHMRHVVHGCYGFCPACCALGILRLSVWAPANRYYPASVNPGSAAYAITEGENLLLTLGANLPATNEKAHQAPWLSDVPPAQPDSVACLAWRPRKLWLNIAAEQGSCAFCGGSSVLVKNLCIEKGWPTPVTTGQQFGKYVRAEFQKLNCDYMAKATDRRKLANKVVKIAPVILKCRMPVLLKADSNAARAPQEECDAAKIARIFDQLYTSGNKKIIGGLTKKPTKEEVPSLDRTDTQVKKFWVDDPHLLKEAEAIGLPDLNADVAVHASKFWRDALRLRGAKAVAIGIVGDGQYLFHDSPAVPLPDAAAAKLASLTHECVEILRGTDAEKRPNEDNEARLKRRGVLRTVTSNPDLKHPEIRAAVILLTPETEARIRAALDNPAGLTDDKQFLRDIYQPVVGQVIDSTAKGSPLRRRAAKDHARALLNGHIQGLVDKATQSAGTVTADIPANPKRGRKKKEAGA